jgi:NTP pyrophosphatase (non-canonical NTP hydrolase)
MFKLNQHVIELAGNALQEQCHGAASSAGWWHDINTGLPVERNVGELLMLCVSELSEAMEGHRKNLMDDKLSHRKMLEVELADAVIRIFDLAGSQGFDLGGAIAEKMAFNANREDHKPENRRAANGKKF